MTRQELDPFACSRSHDQKDLGPDSLKGQVALITGSPAGIGAAILIELSRRGASVVINYPTSRFEEEALKLGKKLDTQWCAICADLGSTEGPKELVSKTVAKFGKIDILVNNAVQVLMAPIEATSLEIWTASIDVNARGAFLVTQAALPHMPKKDPSKSVSGRIINIISSAGREPEPMQTAYAASKSALDAMTKCWTAEIPTKYNVTVNAVTPGITDTPGARANMIEHIDYLKPLFDGRTPMDGWFALPEEIAFAVGFLTHERSSFINGAVINVSGGMFRT